MALIFRARRFPILLISPTRRPASRADGIVGHPAIDSVGLSATLQELLQQN
jgi:hypothetical protein